MMSLDDVSRRLFPTLAAYERRMRRRLLLATILSLLSVYVLGRDLLSAYQGRVATQNMGAMVVRVNNLEEKCQREYPKRAVTTRAEAADSAWRREKGKEAQP